MVALPLTMVVAILRIAYKHHKGNFKKELWKSEIIIQLFILYSISLYQITAVRIGLGLSKERIVNSVRSLNVVPLVELMQLLVAKKWWMFIYHVVGNCIWFIPLGFFMPLLRERNQKWWKVAITAALVSLSIELLQFILCTGVTDLDDVILNTLGAMIGYGIWKIVSSIRASMIETKV
jgi:glycopeptide antibiotics resistance protein